MNTARRGASRRLVPGGQGVTLRALPAVLLCAAALGCGTSQADKVMASVNAFHYFNARYEERCVPQGPVGCAATNAALKTWRKGLDEAGEGLKRGGAIPLQVKHVKKLEKEAAKCLPK